jgi:hypothetical protein
MKSRTPTAILIWIWLCAYLNCAGWGLSALHQLNAWGYAAALGIGFAGLFCWRKQTSARLLSQIRWLQIRRRFRRPFPLALLVLTAMAFIGGVIYAPGNYDALAYRIPRILHWLAENQWHWIHTTFPRVNARTCGIEWVSAPLIALMKTDRQLFLINFISFLLLPGLVFSVFTRLGVRRRVAWHWMWIAPTGYCFLLQTGSAGNDLFGAPFALASVDFALRANTSKSPRDFFASILAAALMTGAKSSNLPLLLPWAIAILPSLKLLLRWPVRALAVCGIAIFASFLPTAVLDAHFCGDWAGVTLEGDQPHGNLFFRTGANVVLTSVQNLTPPVFPAASAWNQFAQKIMPAGLNARLHQTLTESYAAEFRVEDLQIEENAGLGFGVTVLLIMSVTAAKRGAFLNFRFDSPAAAWQIFLRLSPWISMVVLLSQSEVYPIGRILAPYYALLLPLFLANPSHEPLVGKNWWRVSAFAVFVLAAGLLVVSPARPLFPVNLFLEKIHPAAARHPALARVETVYSIYHDRWDGFAPARAALPPELKILGLVTYDDPETSLWRPFGSRRIIHICPQDTAADLKRRGIEYVLVKTDGFESRFGCPPGDWFKRMNARIVQTIPLQLRAAASSADWELVESQ